jgi:hypothetical protein
MTGGECRTKQTNQGGPAEVAEVDREERKTHGNQTARVKRMATVIGIKKAHNKKQAAV